MSFVELPVSLDSASDIRPVLGEIRLKFSNKKRNGNKTRCWRCSDGHVEDIKDWPRGSYQLVKAVSPMTHELQYVLILRPEVY